MSATVAPFASSSSIPDIDLSNTVVLASYPTYAGAQQAVDTLSDRGFPVAETSIVGTDLRMVETVTGRMTTGRAASMGAASGLWFGVFLGIIFGLGTPYFLAPLLWGMLVGIGGGAAFGAFAHRATKGQRDFASVRRLVASRYDVHVRGDLRVRAAQTLGFEGFGMWTKPSDGPAGSSWPAGPKAERI